MSLYHNILGAMLALILLNSPAIAAPSATLSPGGSVVTVHVTGADDCTAVEDAALGDICNDTSAESSGMWYCSTATCDGAGWLRSDDDQTFRGAMVYLSASQAIAINTYTVISWDTEDYDTGGWYDSSGDTFFTVPEGVSRIKVCGNASWAARDEGSRGHKFQVNAVDVYGAGGAVEAGADSSMVSNKSSCSAALQVSAGDLITMVVIQDNPGESNTNVVVSTKSWFSIAEVH